MPGLVLLTLSACSPSLTPLYHDYQAKPGAQPIETRVQAALTEAGWHLVSSPLANTLATEERTLSHWGLYNVVVGLEAVPLGEEHVRLFFHPYRRYVTGKRSKMPFLKRRLRKKLVGGLHDAFAAEGLEALGTAPERDKKTRQ